MSVSEQPTLFSYIGNGVTTTFPYGFYLLSAEDIVVTIGGVEQLSGFSVGGVGQQAGGEIIFTTAPAVGADIKIYRQIALERETDYQPNGDLRSSVLNADFDRLWMALQDGGRDVSRAIRYPIEDEFDGTLPQQGDRAGMLLGFDENGFQTLAPMPSSLGAGDLRWELGSDQTRGFKAGVDYQQGVTTQIVLSRSPISEANCWVYWNGVPQTDFTITDGNKLNFPVPIPVGVTLVDVRIGTTLSLNIPATQSVDDSKVAPGSKLYVRINDEVSVTDPPFNAVMDGLTDDSIAFDEAVAFCIANGSSLWIPDGQLSVPNASPITSGRLFLRGNGYGLIVGNVVYDNPTFPPSVDGPSALDETAPFVSIRNLNFKSVNADWALTVKAPVQGSFIDTMEMQGCRFYGQKGFRGQNLISCSLLDCWFYNTLIGVQAEGSTNWTVMKCWFRQQAQQGFNAIPYAPDPTRTGGENIKFIGCEFAGCAIGVRLQQTQWATFESCLFDYCGLPIYLLGSRFVKLSKTYMGSIILASTAGIPGYQAPPTNGVALYVRPFVDGSSNVYPAGFSATNCEFVSYVPGATLPIAFADGAVSGMPAQVAVDRASFVQCKFLTSVAHAMQYMAQVSLAQIANFDDCEFISPNLSSSLLAPYTMVNCTSFRASSNDSLHCTQAGVQVKVTQEKTITADLQMVDNMVGLSVLNEAAAQCFQVKGTGNDRVFIFTGSTLKPVGSGPADSGGAGFRQLIVPN